MPLHCGKPSDSDAPAAVTRMAAFTKKATMSDSDTSQVP